MDSIYLVYLAQAYGTSVYGSNAYSQECVNDGDAGCVVGVAAPGAPNTGFFIEQPAISIASAVLFGVMLYVAVLVVLKKLNRSTSKG